jgi:hypothetical protein
MKNVVIEFQGSVALSVAEIWPDGDAPEEPHVRDVIEKMQAAGSKLRMLDDWNLEQDLTISVTDLETNDTARY